MDAFILEMARLYRKIEEGTASDNEREKFIWETETCCMSYDLLMSFIKYAAKNLKD